MRDKNRDIKTIYAYAPKNIPMDKIGELYEAFSKENGASWLPFNNKILDRFYVWVEKRNNSGGRGET